MSYQPRDVLVFRYEFFNLKSSTYCANLQERLFEK
jgi:hypothetical protein